MQRTIRVLSFREQNLIDRLVSGNVDAICNRIDFLKCFFPVDFF